MAELALYDVPSAMTPMLPEISTAALRELATELIKKSSKLAGALNANTRLAIAKLIEPMNSYYSNLIEGHFTHPLDIEKALKKNYDKEPKKKLLQLESRAHVLVNQNMKIKLRQANNIYNWEFISWLHKSFYEHVPASMRNITTKEGKKI